MHRAREPGCFAAGTPRRGDIQCEKDRGRGIDRHGGRNLLERDAGKEPFHVFDGIDRHSGPTHLAGRPVGVGIVADLGREVERDRKPVTALGE